MNEQSPICQKCPLREAFPIPREMPDGTTKKFTCFAEKTSEKIDNRIVEGILVSLPDKRSAYSELRKQMYRQDDDKPKCPDDEIKRLIELPQRQVDPHRHDYSNIRITPSTKTVADSYHREQRARKNNK